MKLQISFDLTDINESIRIAKEVAEHANIIEVGSILIYKYGVEVIEKFREALPNAVILADIKIVDRGREVVSLLENGGANWLTVIAGGNKSAIHSACTAAHDYKKNVMMNLMDVDFVGQAALEAKSLGADALLFHKVYVESEAPTFKDKWEMIKGNSSLPVFISAKITRENIDQIIELKPDGIVVGESITLAENPAEEAKFFAEKCRQ